jgi:hypothetical protein
VTWRLLSHGECAKEIESRDNLIKSKMIGMAGSI